MKIARNLPVSDRHDEWHPPLPAPSLRELSRPTGVTEGVSFDGSSMPTIYTPAIINSETFERLRSSKYTPSVSHSLDSSLREGAGNAIIQPGAVQRAARKPEGCGRFSSPLRKAFSIHRRGGKNLILPLYNSFQIMYSIVEQSRKPCVKCCWNGELYGRRRTKSPR